VKIERNTGSGFVTLVPAFNAVAQNGQAAIPSDFLLSLTGSTGGSNNNHEIDNVQICALKSNPIGAQIDHFEFDHTGLGLTCNAETVTIRACANVSCSQLFTAPLSATLLPDSATDGVWVGGNQVSFSGGTAQLQLRRNTPGVVTLGVKGSNPTTKPLSKTLCRVGSGSLSENACSLTFADSGFIFDVPDKLANKPINVLVKAVKKSDVTQQCVPSFQSQTKTLNFWSSYQTPSAPISPKAVTINNMAIGTSSASPTAVNLVFDTNGQASIAVNYPDAGKLQLDANYVGSGNEQDLVMIGSDQFVSVPAGLCVKPVDANASCSSANMMCNVYRKAGQTFGMTVQAMAWEKDGDKDFCSGNLSTPNFSDQGMRLASQVVEPKIASGGYDGALGVASYSHSAQANNLNTISNQTISEVGVFQIAAQATPNYLGTASSLNIPIGYSANIGRFVPDRFLVSDISVIPACGGFNYMDQLFPMSMKLSALNIAGDITKNYFPPFSLATAKLVGENNNNGVDLQSRLSALLIKADSWDQGVAMVDASYLANFSRVTPNVATNLYQDGPFESLDIGVQLMDNDPRPNGIYSYVASPDMDAATTGNCTNCNAKKISTQILRHGRVVMDNTYGPETEILRMPTRAEYWNGSSWAINTADSCTLTTYSLASQVDNAGLGYNFDPDLVVGQSVTRSGGALTFQAGQFELLWQAVTSSGVPYRGQVTAPLDVPPWLEWYWNWNGVSPSVLTEPRASAYFGRYRGHDKIIYWREVN
jgi:MSHA biogenesis protein MshQ